jgi:hypothetical protein
MKEARELLKDLKDLFLTEGDFEGTFVIYYKNGTILHSEELEEAKQIKLNNIAFMAYMDGYINIDTDGGNFNNCDDYWEHTDKIYSKRAA